MLDRTQPVLPMRPGQVERRTHDYTRHGTTTLFAALDAKTGTVIADTHPRHRSVEFRKFLDRIDASVPADLDVHLILDNAHNDAPKPFVWTKSADDILASIGRFATRTLTAHGVAD